MELQINGKTYRTGRLNGRQQFHVVRRLLPLAAALMKGLTSMGDAMNALRAAVKGDGNDAALPDGVSVGGFIPVAEMLAGMPDDECDYVLNSCLSVCERLETDKWARVMSPNGTLMYDDLGLPGMMELTFVVVKENCAGFFPDPSGTTSK